MLGKRHPATFALLSAHVANRRLQLTSMNSLLSAESLPLLDPNPFYYPQLQLDPKSEILLPSEACFLRSECLFGARNLLFAKTLKHKQIL